MEEIAKQAEEQLRTSGLSIHSGVKVGARLACYR